MKPQFEFYRGIGFFIGYQDKVFILALPFVAMIWDTYNPKVEEKKHKNKYRNALKNG